MDALKRLVMTARRRMMIQRFLGVVTWCLFAAATVVAIMVVVDKFRPLHAIWWAWGAGAAASGLLLACIITWFRRYRSLDAAIEIDRRFGLKERVSSSLSLQPSELESDAGQALVADAVRRAERVYLPEKFRLSLGRWSWLPALPIAAAVLVALFFDPPVGPQALSRSQAAVQRKQVQENTAALREKMLERRKEAREKGLKSAEQVFEKLEQGAKQLTKNDEVDKKQAMIKLNDLSKELEDRKKELGSGEQLKQQLNQLKNLDRGPADKLADAMKKGDFQQAVKELKNLREQLDKGKLSKEDKEKLANQLNQMQKKLGDMAEKHKQAQEELKKQIAEKRAAGKGKEAEQLEKQLNQMAQKNQQAQQMQQMADKLGKAAEAMKKGDQKQAQQAMEQLQNEVKNIEQQMAEEQMLDDAMNQLADAKNKMGEGEGEGMDSMMMQGRPGQGLGRGRGDGARPEEKNKTGMYDTKAQQKTGKGAAIVTDLVDGPTMKGQVSQQIKTDLEAAKAADSDPLTDQPLPRGYRDHTKEYFQALREGK